ncbi:helix-turn-helix domain-containing protein [Neisseria gonorrhoeae]|uniref:helix-turn-helix domain-containing protein n=1 Tax=Neisseria gonorrhoeae TaxID=485 RepID=UPI001F0B92F8|nr:helix-turn-helix domain-containing protein [Neisseria gonorrhoeae]
MSQKAAADQLNLPDCSVLPQWLRLYRLNGINGLKPKPKGRKPVKNSIRRKRKSRLSENQGRTVCGIGLP